DPISYPPGDHGYDALDVPTPSLRGRRIVTRSLGERSEQFSVLSIETRQPCELGPARRNRIRAGRPFPSREDLVSLCRESAHHPRDQVVAIAEVRVEGLPR